MASRLLTRSKALALALSRADAAASPAAGPVAGAQWIRSLSSLPRDPAVAAAAPAPRQPAVGSPLGLSKIPGYEQTSRLSGTQVLPRWFSTGISNGSSAQQEGATTKVMAFSPLEASIAKPRSGPLTAESSKVKRTEIVTQATYYMIPTLLLVSRNSILLIIMAKDTAVYFNLF
uniref:Chlorophyll a-b binding protein, chloroplastic n=1 Tax=Leersia perrieri TaxID=77586 RepID=A0A0D9V9Z7_9ORYZ